MAKLEWTRILDRLEAEFGRVEPRVLATPLAMVLWENVAYLADDDARARAFDALVEKTALSPQAILALSKKDVREITARGIMPDMQAEKLPKIARLAMKDSPRGDLSEILEIAEPKARKILKGYPGIGDPGADWILLALGRIPIVALESNGLRTAVRLGYGTEDENYAKMLKSAKAALRANGDATTEEWIRLRAVLRRHGQTICKRTAPACDRCPLADRCKYFAAHGESAKAMPKKKTAARAKSSRARPSSKS